MDYSTFFTPPMQAFQFAGLPSTQDFTSTLGDTFTNAFDSTQTEPLQYCNLPEQTSELLVPLNLGVNDLVHPDQDDVLNFGHSSLSIDGHNPGEDVHIKEQRRGSSEEKELTPAQSRRKAQNRAAQRAFRERKERHVKELEAKLSDLEKSASTLASQNKRLELQLQSAENENKLLRIRNSISLPSSSSGSPRDGLISMSRDDPSDQSTAGQAPIFSTSPSAGFASVAQEALRLHRSTTPSSESDCPTPELRLESIWSTKTKKHSIRSATISASDDKLIPVGQIWDVIQAHPLIKSGHIEIADVCEKLKGSVRCSSDGSVFRMGDIRHAIETSKRKSLDDIMPF